MSTMHMTVKCASLDGITSSIQTYTLDGHLH